MAAPVRPAGVNRVSAEIPDCFFPWQSDRTRGVTDRAEASQAADFGLVGVYRNCSLARPPGCETGYVQPPMACPDYCVHQAEDQRCVYRNGGVQTGGGG